MQTTSTQHQPLARITTPWQRYQADKAKANEHLAGVDACWQDRFGDAGCDFVTETFSACYAPDTDRLPAEQVAKGAQWATKANDLLEELPEWKRLTKRTRGDQFASMIATTTLGESVLSSLPGDAKQDDSRPVAQEVDALQWMAGNGGPGAGVAAAAATTAEALLRKLDKAGQKLADSMADETIREALRGAIAKANDAVDAAEEGMLSFGWDMADPNPKATGNADTKAALAGRIRNSDKLKQVAAKAGRLRRMAAQRQRERVQHGTDEMTDIEQGGDLGRLLPAELARLAGGKLQRLALVKDLLDRQALQYRLEGVESKGRGPIVMLLDESGSMEGDRDTWCKAIFLALLEIARRQNRVCALVHFSSRVDKVDVLRPGQYTPADVMGAVEYFANGGTSFWPALDAAANLIRTEGGLRKADMVMVTDGLAGDDAEALQRWLGVKAELAVQCYGMAVGMGVTDQLRAITDEAVSLQDLAAGSLDEMDAADMLFRM